MVSSVLVCVVKAEDAEDNGIVDEEGDTGKDMTMGDTRAVSAPQRRVISGGRALTCYVGCGITLARERLESSWTSTIDRWQRVTRHVNRSVLSSIVCVVAVGAGMGTDGDDTHGPQRSHHQRRACHSGQ